MRVSQNRRSDEDQEQLRECEERVRRSSQADIIEQTQAELKLERTVRSLFVLEREEGCREGKGLGRGVERGKRGGVREKGWE